MKKYFRDLFVSFALFAIIASVLEHSYYISLRLISSTETANVFFMNFLLYALVFPAVTSGFAMWLFIRNNNNPTIESKKQLLIILVASSVISYMLLLGKDETWMATGYWVSSVFGDVKMFLGLLSYSCIFTLAGYVINSLKRPAVAQ